MSTTVEKCIHAWTNSLRQMNAKADIVFLGDSLIYYGDFASVFPNNIVCNLGLRGDTIRGMIDRVEQVIILRPKMVFLMAGINDVSNMTVDDFYVLYEQLINKLRIAPIVIQSILPVNSLRFSVSCNNHQIKHFNSFIEKLANDYNLVYLDLFSLFEEDGQLSASLTIDGIHLKRKGYERWYEAINSSISLDYDIINGRHSLSSPV